MPDLSNIIATIEASNLVSDEVVDELRHRLEKSRQPVDLKSAVKWLVQKEHITSEQGRRLLAKSGGSAAQPARPAPPDDDLKLVDDEPVAAPPPAKPSKPISRAPAAPAPEIDDDLELFPMDDAAEAAEPARAAPPPSRPSKPSSPRWAGSPQPEPPQPAASRRRRPAEPVYAEAVEADLFDAAAEHGGYADEMVADEREQKRAKGPQRSVWDSPLLLLGGGLLLILICGGLFFYWRIGRLTGEEAYRQAKEMYDSGSYTQAIDKFDKFLTDFPEDPQAGIARVQRGMARMRQSVEGARDYSKTLATAKQILSEIGPEEQFGEAQKELAALLPQIAEGLAKQAAAKPDQKLVDEGDETLKLVEKYVRKSLRPEQKLADVRASLEVTKRTMGRDQALADAIAGIQKAIADGSPQAAYKIRKDLLKQYPSLAGNEELQKAVLSLSKAEQQAVVYKPEAKQAAPADAQSPVEAEIVMSDRQGRDAPDVGGRLVEMLADGAVYSLEADTGKVLWRRFVGYDTTYVPRPVGVDNDSDLLVVDAQRNEVLRVERRTGKLKWRFVVGEPFDAHPVIARDHVWVATRQNKLVRIELDTGDSPGYVSLPQGLRVGPAFDSRGQSCFQIGEHSNLFSLSGQTFQCQEVLYLGHEAESVHVAPLIVSPYIFVAVDEGGNDSLLHVLMADENGTNIRQAQSPITLAGHVLAPLETAGRTLVVATDRGALYSFEINPPDPGPPLVKVADTPPEDRAPLIRYPLLRETQLWVAGLGVTKYDVQASRGKLDPKWVKDESDVFLEQPRVIGDVLFNARRQGGQPEVIVGAMNANDGSRYWETRVAAPPAGAPMTDAKSGRTLLFNRVGALFDLSPEALAKNGVQNAAASPADFKESFSGAFSTTSLAGGGAAISSTTVGPRALVATPADKLQWLSLPDPLGAPAIGFQGGLLAPGRLGQVLLLDPLTGTSLVQPFQPRLERGAAFRWTEPALLNDREVLISDGQAKLYRIGTVAKPEPHLAALAEANLEGPITAPLAVVGKTAFAVDGKGQLVAFAVGEPGTNLLSAGKSWPLSPAVAWGPCSAGSQVLVATTDGRLACVSESQELVWQVELKHGPLAGKPLAGDNTVLLTTKSGQVCRLNLASGEETGAVDVGEPIAAGPVALGKRLLLAAKGGALLVVASP